MIANGVRVLSLSHTKLTKIFIPKADCTEYNNDVEKMPIIRRKSNGF